MREYRTCGILGGIPPAEPRIENRKCSLDETRGKNKTDLPTSSKWQIGLFLWLKVARREPERSAASAKRAATTHRGIPKGAALGAPLVTFPASGKSPGCRAWQSHALAERLQVGAGTTSPARKSPGAWGGAPIHGAAGKRCALPAGEIR